MLPWSLDCGNSRQSSTHKVYGLKKNGAIYKYLLVHNNNTVYMINEDKYLNYDKLDYRILMIEQNKYDKFIDNNGNDFFSHLIYTPCCKK